MPETTAGRDAAGCRRDVRTTPQGGDCYVKLFTMTAILPATCARCNGSGWIPLAGDSLRVEPCGCQGDLRRRQRIAASNIPRRYYPHCTLETFYDKNNAVLKSARNRVR